jgi:hypothetical protein
MEDIVVVVQNFLVAAFGNYFGWSWFALIVVVVD